MARLAHKVLDAGRCVSCMIWRVIGKLTDLSCPYSTTDPLSELPSAGGWGEMDTITMSCLSLTQGCQVWVVEGGRCYDNALSCIFLLFYWLRATKCGWWGREMLWQCLVFLVYHCSFIDSELPSVGGEGGRCYDNALSFLYKSLLFHWLRATKCGWWSEML